MTEKAKLQRMCVGCRQLADKRQLCRVVRTPEGNIMLDATGRANGRGAYIHRDAACLEKAFKSRALERALKQALSEDVRDELKRQAAAD